MSPPRPPSDPLLIYDDQGLLAFEIIDELGSGGFVRVYLARDCRRGHAGRLVCLRVPKDDTDDARRNWTDRMRRFRRGYEAHVLLGPLGWAPNAILWIESVDKTPHFTRFANNDRPMPVMAITRMELGNLLVNMRLIDRDTRRSLIAWCTSGVLSAFAAAHRHDHVQGDPSPMNVLLNLRGGRIRLVVTDFDLVHHPSTQSSKPGGLMGLWVPDTKRAAVYSGKYDKTPFPDKVGWELQEIAATLRTVFAMPMHETPLQPLAQPGAGQAEIAEAEFFLFLHRLQDGSFRTADEALTQFNAHTVPRICTHQVTEVTEETLASLKARGARTGTPRAEDDAEAAPAATGFDTQLPQGYAAVPVPQRFDTAPVAVVPDPRGFDTVVVADAPAHGGAAAPVVRTDTTEPGLSPDQPEDTEFDGRDDHGSTSPVPAGLVGRIAPLAFLSLAGLLTVSHAVGIGIAAHLDAVLDGDNALGKPIERLHESELTRREVSGLLDRCRTLATIATWTAVFTDAGENAAARLDRQDCALHRGGKEVCARAAAGLADGMDEDGVEGARVAEQLVGVQEHLAFCTRAHDVGADLELWGAALSRWEADVPDGGRPYLVRSRARLEARRGKRHAAVELFVDSSRLAETTDALAASSVESLNRRNAESIGAVMCPRAAGTPTDVLTGSLGARKAWTGCGYLALGAPKDAWEHWAVARDAFRDRAPTEHAEAACTVGHDADDARSRVQNLLTQNALFSTFPSGISAEFTGAKLPCSLDTLANPTR